MLNERRAQCETDPFIDPTEWHRYLDELKTCFHNFLHMSDEEIDEMYKESSFLTCRDICPPYLEEKL